MKSLIYELFSGVGLCNQIFSLETAIYLANISNRRLILLIKNPLCHCGRADWDYGYLLNYFTNDFRQYLPNGLEVYYKNPPQDILDIINDLDRCYRLRYCTSYSDMVFVDKYLDTTENATHIKDYCHWRKKASLNFDENRDFEYLYTDQSNASRCFYNFYTSQANYLLMYNICKSLKFKTFFYDIADNLYQNLGRDNKNNSHNIFMHLRFGDNNENINFITRNNQDMIANLSTFIDGHKTNMINPSVYALVDNKKNAEFFKAVEKYNITYVDILTKDYITTYLGKNNMLFLDYNKTHNNDVANAIIEMLLSSKSDEFIGTVSSTFSHYIQYLRYVNNKSYYNYCTFYKNKNVANCRLVSKTDNVCEWIKYDYHGGHPVSWHLFWDLKLPRHDVLMTIHGKIDGFGSQLQACFSLMAYCKYKGYKYIHTPMYAMEHCDTSIPEFHTYMNNFINIESRYTTINQITNFEKSCIHTVKEGAFVHGALHPEYFYNEAFLNEIRKIYFSKDKPVLEYYLPGEKNIALHIRRGDVDVQKYPSRYTENQKYIDLLNKLSLENSVIHIFSEGKHEDFVDIIKSFPDTRCILHINENIQSSFHGLVMADTLVIARSSFSYCAGLLNKNVIIASFITEWWHKPLKSWSII